MGREQRGSSTAQISSRGRLGRRYLGAAFFSQKLSISPGCLPHAACLHRAARHIWHCPAHATSDAPNTHGTNFHLVLHGVYKNPSDANLEQLQLLEELTLQRLGELNAESLITIMFAFARSRYPPDPCIQHRMVSATEANLTSFTPRQLEHVAWSLAAMHYEPSDSWLDNFAHALQDNWDAFRPPQLASTLVQAAACGLTHLPAPTLLVQMPALLRRGMAAMSGMEPETLAKLVWSAGHYQPLISNALNAASATQTGAQAEKGGNTLVAGDPAGAPSLTVLSVLPEQELLDWWESEGVVEAASLGDLVLLLHGMARLGMQPGPVLMRRLLAAVMDSPDTLAQLLPQQLAILAWSALKLVEEPFKREWIDGLVLALQHHTRQARMQRRGTHLAAADSVEQELRVEQYGLESSERANALLEEGFQPPVVPTDVALALSSLAGLGGQLSPATRGEFQAYWRTAAHWDALPRQDRLVMSLLGYEPEVEDSSVS